MAQITLNSSGVASSGSLLLQTNGTTTQATVDTSGNLGLGVTPSAWISTFKSIDVSTYASFYGRTSAVTAGIASNAYQNSGGTWTYKASNYAAKYDVDTGQHVWWNAASGTAGNAITFTQAMTLDSSGNLGIGTTSPTRKFQVSNTSADPFISISGAVSNNGGLLFGDNASDATGQLRYDHSSDAMYFVTNGSEAARIDSSGNLLVNTTTANGKIAVITTGQTTLYVARTETSAANNIVLANGNGNVGFIQTSGSSTSYLTSSDYRLKDNVQPMTGALAKVATLKPVTYNWKIDGSQGEGFIAHELKEVCPYAVAGEKDDVNEDGSIKPQSIDTSFLVATLTAALQEAHGLIKDLQTRVAALES